MTKQINTALMSEEKAVKVLREALKKITGEGSMPIPALRIAFDALNATERVSNPARKVEQEVRANLSARNHVGKGLRLAEAIAADTQGVRDE